MKYMIANPISSDIIDIVVVSIFSPLVNYIIGCISCQGGSNEKNYICFIGFSFGF